VQGGATRHRRHAVDGAEDRPGSRGGARWRAAALLLGTLVALMGCAGPARHADGPVRVIGSWTGDELAALRSVLDLFTERTGHVVEVDETRDLRGVIGARLQAGDPPDLAGVSGPAHLSELAHAGALRPLSSAIDVGAYKAGVAPTFIELGSVDGRLVGAFIKSTAKGLVWYDPRVFRLGIPTTWDDLQRMATAAATPPTRPWCVGLASGEASGWPGTDWIEAILIRQAGSNIYDRWVDGQLAWASREVRLAFERYGQVVAEDAVHGGRMHAIETDFSVAGEPLFSRPPGCLFLLQGSFMLPFLAGPERVPGEDLDFFPLPDIDPAHGGSVVGAGDLVVLLTDRPAARDLMAFLVSAEGRAAWVATGAALSVNARVTDYPNEVAARAAEVLVSADRFRFDASDEMPTAMSEAFSAAVVEFTADQRRLGAILDGLDAVRRDAYAR
jgi:alpha-glucoside transport system substrate-binding protein